MGLNKSRVEFDVSLPISDDILIRDWISVLKKEIVFLKTQGDYIKSLGFESIIKELNLLEFGVLPYTCSVIVQYRYTKTNNKLDTVILDTCEKDGIKMFSFGDYSRFSTHDNIFIDNSFWLSKTEKFDSLSSMDERLFELNLSLLPEYRNIITEFFNLKIRNKTITFSDCY